MKKRDNNNNDNNNNNNNNNNKNTISIHQRIKKINPPRRTQIMLMKMGREKKICHYPASEPLDNDASLNKVYVKSLWISLIVFMIILCL